MKALFVLATLIPLLFAQTVTTGAEPSNAERVLQLTNRVTALE